MSTGSKKQTKSDFMELSFEEALSTLEKIIQQMESGDAPLDSLVTHYQNGVRMLKICRSKLNSAELKINEVKEIDGELCEKNFEETF